MAIDLKNADIFFNEIRNTIFGGHLSQEQVDGINKIFVAFEKYEFVEDQEERAYILATTYHESAHTMQPIKEYGLGKGKAYGVPINGHVYYGRGYVQLTWDYNYKKLGGILGVDLYNHPELALDPEIAAGVLIVGMMRGLFAPAAGPLSKYLRTDEKWVEARHTVNGNDRDVLIAGYAKKFDAAMEKAEGKVHVHLNPDVPAVVLNPTPSPIVITSDTTPSPTPKPVVNNPVVAPSAAGGGLIAGGLAASQFGMSWGWMVTIAIVVAVVGAAIVIYKQSQASKAIKGK